jgi:hypothetical protein
MARGGSAILTINTRLVRELSNLGGARTPEMTGAAKVLKKSLKKVLGIKGNGKPSKPGEPPRKQSGELEKSVVSGVVGAGQRVGLTSFVAPLLEFGVDTRADGVAPRSNRDLFTREQREISLPNVQKLARKFHRRKAGNTKKVRHQKLDARPFVDKAIEAAEQKIVDVQVSAIRRRLPGGF